MLMPIFCRAVWSLTDFSLTYEADIENEEQLASIFVEKVVGINLSNYDYTIVTLRPGENIDINFHISNKQSNITATVVFTRGLISWFYFKPRSPPSWLWTDETNNTLYATTQIVDQYMLSFNLSYTQIPQLLEQALPNQNQSIRGDDYVLNIEKGGHRFIWNYVIDGVTVYMPLGLDVSEDGHLIYFVSNIGLYDIGSTLIAVSEEHARDIALPYAEDYANEHDYIIESVKTTLSYGRDIWCSRGNDYTLYPKWDVEIFFNQHEENSGGVIGYQVSLWADTGVLILASPLGMFNEDSPPNFIFPLAMITGTIAIVLSVLIFTYKKRNIKKR